MNPIGNWFFCSSPVFITLKWKCIALINCSIATRSNKHKPQKKRSEGNQRPQIWQLILKQSELDINLSVNGIRIYLWNRCKLMSLQNKWNTRKVQLLNWLLQPTTSLSFGYHPTQMWYCVALRIIQRNINIFDAIIIIL